MAHSDQNDSNGTSDDTAPPAPAQPKLRLKRETIRHLRTLTVDELGAVAGGIEVVSKDGGPGGVQC